MEKTNTIEAIYELIKRRRFQILVNSYILFKLQKQLVPVETLTQWAKELIRLQDSYPEISKSVELYELFRDFTSPEDAKNLAFDDNPTLHLRAVKLLEYADRREEK